MSVGGDFVVIGLLNGNVLKISNRAIVAPLGERPFDIPVLEKGTKLSKTGLPIHYIIQPMAAVPVGSDAMRRFRRNLREHGYAMIDGGKEQVGVHLGEPKLLDVFAVRRFSNDG